MPKFRKKPITIEAVQFTGGNGGSVNDLVDFAGMFRPLDVEDRPEPDVVAEVWDKLHATWVGVKIGQWIIQGVQGEFYPCDEDVFRDTYEKVD